MNLYIVRKINGETVYVVAKAMIDALQYVENVVACEVIATNDAADCNLSRLIVSVQK